MYTPIEKKIDLNDGYIISQAKSANAISNNSSQSQDRK